MRRTIVAAGLLASLAPAGARAQKAPAPHPSDEQVRARAELARLDDAEARLRPELERHLVSQNPYEVLGALELATAHPELVTESELPHVVELLDDTAPRMPRHCLQLLADGDPLARGDLSEGLVNEYPAEAHACRTGPWPTIAAGASSVLARASRDVVARLLVARAIAHPESAEHLAVAARAGGAAHELASAIAAQLARTSDPARVRALLRLALEVRSAIDHDVEAFATLAASAPPAVQARACIALLRVSDPQASRDHFVAARKQAVALLERSLDAEALADLATIGPAADPMLPALAKHLHRGDPQLEAVLGVLAAIGPGARTTLPVLLRLLHDKTTPGVVARAVASVGAGSPAARGALIDLATQPFEIDRAVTALAAQDVQLSPAEQRRLDRIYDRVCLAPERKMEREMGEAFDEVTPGCEGVAEGMEKLDKLSAAPRSP